MSVTLNNNIESIFDEDSYRKDKKKKTARFTYRNIPYIECAIKGLSIFCVLAF